MSEHDSLLGARLREWLAECDRQAVETRDAAESYRGVDMEAVVDMSRSLVVDIPRRSLSGPTTGRG